GRWSLVICDPLVDLKVASRTISNIQHPTTNIDMRPHSSFDIRWLGVRYSRLTHLRLGCTLRPIVPVLCVRDVRHAPLMAVPAIESIHPEAPDSRVEVADHDQPVSVPYVDAPSSGLTTHHSLTCGTLCVRAFAGVVIAHRVGVGRIHHVEYLS